MGRVGKGGGGDAFALLHLRYCIRLKQAVSAFAGSGKTVTLAGEWRLKHCGSEAKVHGFDTFTGTHPVSPPVLHYCRCSCAGVSQYQYRWSRARGDSTIETVLWRLVTSRVETSQQY